MRTTRCAAGRGRIDPGSHMDGFVQQFLTMLVALAGVLALAWGGLHLLRGRLAGRAPRGGATDDEALRFVRALPVGPKERVVLMDHRGERWMLGVTAGGISLLARWPVGSAPNDLPAPAQAPMRATLAAADPD
jgi:flagellar protein FliO/FliZ